MAMRRGFEAGIAHECQHVREPSVAPRFHFGANSDVMGGQCARDACHGAKARAAGESVGEEDVGPQGGGRGQLETPGEVLPVQVREGHARHGPSFLLFSG